MATLKISQPMHTRAGVSLHAGVPQRRCGRSNNTMAGGERASHRGQGIWKLQQVPHTSLEDSWSMGETAPRAVHEALGSPGQRLDPATRAFFEPRFGHDFSQVQVHTDGKAAESARAVNALAYTVGQDVVFGGAQYAPGTDQGRRLLAHELTHTLQQRGAGQVERALGTSQPGHAAEVEAERAAHGISRGVTFVPTVSIPATVSRQAGPDAGAPGSAAGAPAAGPGAAASPVSPASAPTAPATAPVVRSIDVENQREAITYRVPSNLGAGGRSHWVTIAGTRPDIIVRANLDSALPAADPAVAGLRWESDPGGQVSPGGDALHATLPVPRARKVVVRASLGGSQAESTIWAVFVSTSVTAGPTGPTATRRASQLSIRTSINFTGQVHPSTIINDADQPALKGANTVDPPGGTNVCGSALAGGVDHRWDMSRQRRRRNVDPAGLIPALVAAENAASGQGCLYTASAYPAAPEVGNDDAGTGDENNDPYAGGGMITSSDSPLGGPYYDAIGADGDTLEEHIQFREFARLELNGTWWKVSHFVPWRAHYRARKVAGKWQNNGSDSAPDNAGLYGNQDARTMPVVVEPEFRHVSRSRECRPNCRSQRRDATLRSSPQSVQPARRPRVGRKDESVDGWPRPYDAGWYCRSMTRHSRSGV